VSEPTEPPSERGTSVAAGNVLIVGLVGLVLAALMNADSLVEQAERKPFGWSRTASLAVWHPMQDVSNVLRLGFPRDVVDEATGRADDDTDDFEFPTETAEPVTTSTVPPDPELRTPTAAEPLRVWVGGDSMSQVFGQSLVAMADDTDLMSADLDYRISTGLTRPDYFNWPAHISEEFPESDPEAVVIMFGANDAQGMEVEGEVFQTLDENWTAEYRRRVAGTMDLLEDEGRIVYWVGQPIMRDADFSSRMAGVNEIYRSEAESRPWVRYIDAYEMFADDSGAYEAFLPDVAGDVQDMRQGDGIHLSRPGGDLLARAVLDQIEADAKL